MSYNLWGKVLGAFFGYLLAGPIGAAFGILVGNMFDKGLSTHTHKKQWHYQAERQMKTQEAYFAATFSVMGHLAKSDGRVSEKEIDMARLVMDKMRLNSRQKQQAIKYFNQGKQYNFDLHKTIDRLISSCQFHSALLKIFAEIQYQAAMADGMGPRKQQILEIIFGRLGIAPIFKQYSHYHYRSGHQNYQSSWSNSPPNLSALQQAYETLEIKEGSTKSEVKKAYRKQMSQNHPDKLIAQGLPESMIKMATDKTQKIQSAYELICKTLG